MICLTEYMAHCRILCCLLGAVQFVSVDYKLWLLWHICICHHFLVFSDYKLGDSKQIPDQEQHWTTSLLRSGRYSSLTVWWFLICLGSDSVPYVHNLIRYNQVQFFFYIQHKNVFVVDLWWLHKYYMDCWLILFSYTSYYTESDTCHRQFCGPARGFSMHITDNLGQVGDHLCKIITK